MDWCGEDCAFVTWGCDDVSVLQQNVDFFRVERPLPKMYDLQRLYAAEAGKSGQTALKTAMEALGVEVDEERSFHNAMHDAYYTAQVLRKLPHPMDVLRYEEQPRKLCHNDRRSRFRVTDLVPSVREALEGEALAAPKCPTCGQPTKRQTALIPQAPGKYVALSRCQQHGQMFVKIRFSQLPDGQKGMHLSVLPANRQTQMCIRDSNKLANVEIDENAMKKPEAIIRSMTPRERRNPGILNASRRKRIAAGSGTTVQDVNALIRQFEQAKGMMKQMMNARGKRGRMRLPF